MVLRGSSEDEPSPSNSDCRNARLTAAGACQTNDGTHLAALRWPTSSPSTLRRSASRSWTSSSCSMLPDAIVRSIT